MTIQNLRFRPFLAFLVCATVTACSSDAVTLGDASGPRPDTTGHGPPPAPIVPVPRFRGDIVVYERVSPVSSSSPAAGSRFVVFPDGAISLEYVRADATIGQTYYPYHGFYIGGDVPVQFVFTPADSTAPRTANVAVRGDSLFVEYNDVMHSAHFEDGVYVRPSPAPPPTSENIYVSSAEGTGKALRLTRGGWPTWSPDGQRIAFHRDGKICVIDIDGSNESCLGPGSFPSWAPFPTRIAFANSEGIAVMDADGSNVQTLVRHNFRTDTYSAGDLGVGEPSWSPDGQSIAFLHFGDGDTKIQQTFVMRSDGSDVHMLTEPGHGVLYAESDPAWSRDGKRILFGSFYYGIASVDAGGGVPASLYKNLPAGTFAMRPSQSPDAAALIYTLRDRATGARSIWVSGRDLGIPDGHDAVWSPEGKWMAYARGQ